MSVQAPNKILRHPWLKISKVPGNMIITGAMLAYQSTPQQVIFWQLANQSVNAVVNYTNRSGDAEISTAELSRNFLGATTLASGTALGIKKVAL